MKNTNPIRVKTLTEFHRLRGLTKPDHPLISVTDYFLMNYSAEEKNGLVYDFYAISIKRNVQGKFRYGQKEYDFDEGVIFFTAPNKIFRMETNLEDIMKISGWVLLIHPDFLWNTSLAKTIRQNDFFDYSVNEALFLSEKEEAIINNIILLNFPR